MPGPLRDPSSRALERLRCAGVDAGPAPADGYDGWTVDRLRRRAAELGVPGRSGMRKEELIRALRSH